MAPAAPTRLGLFDPGPRLRPVRPAAGLPIPSLGPVHPRLRLVVIGVLACGFAAVAGVWIAALTRADGVAPKRTSATALSGALRPPGAGVGDFALRDQDGTPVTPASSRGKTTIYAFIYSHCQDVCPLEVQQIRGAMDGLGRDVPVVGISVDPAHDTRASARAFMVAQHMTGRMRFALGDRAELEPVWRAFGIQPQSKEDDHSASIVVVDGRGRQRVGYAASFLTVDGLERDLRRLGA